MSAVQIYSQFISKEVSLVISAFNGKFQVAVFDKTQGGGRPPIGLEFKGEDIISYLLLACDKLAGADGDISVPITQMAYRPNEGYKVESIINLYRNSNGVFGLEISKGNHKYDFPLLAKKDIGLGGNIPDEPTRSKAALSTFRRAIENSTLALMKSKENASNYKAGNTGGNQTNTSVPPTPPVPTSTITL